MVVVLTVSNISRGQMSEGSDHSEIHYNSLKLQFMNIYSRAVSFKTETENRGFKEKPNRNRTAVFWRPCDGFSRISKMAQPGHKHPQTTPHYHLTRTPAGTV